MKHFIENFLIKLKLLPGELQLSDSELNNYDDKLRRSWRRYVVKIYLDKYFPIFLFFNIGIKGFVAVICSAIWWLFVTIFLDHRPIRDTSPKIRIWFGVPGSGKTSVGAWLSQKSLKAGRRVLSNVEIKGTYKLTASDLGNYDMSFDGQGCHIIYDEAGIDFDNRNFAAFSKTQLPKFFALHRHMLCQVDVFSQSYDIDKKIRDRAANGSLFYLQRLPFRGYVLYRRIKKVLFIKKDDKQMVDGFSFYGLPRIIRVKSVWDSFDTLDKSLCPTATKEWELWFQESDQSDD